MKKITFFTIMVVLLLSGAIYSCNGFEDFDFNESTALTDEAQALKELYQAEIPKLGELIETRAGSGLTEEEAETFLASFSTQTVSMLKSYGFTEKDWEEFNGIQDPRFICLGFFFLAVADSNTDNQSFTFIKSRSPEHGEEENCWTVDNIKDCLIEAVGIDGIIDLGELSGLFMGCMGKEIVFTTLKQFLRKTLPPAISLTIIIMEFAQCMSNK